MLRMSHPDLFCKAEKLEQRNKEYRISKGKPAMYLHPDKKPLSAVVDDKQKRLFEEDEYPPCECLF
jgi:hypothetical protein